MDWPAVFLVLLLSHLAGDFLLQTEWQAVNKHGGLGRSPESRRALRNHALTYTLAFVPGLVWIALERSPALAVLLAAVVGVPHAIIDDGRLLRSYVREVKGCLRPAPGLLVAVDQSFHVVMLLPIALVAAA